MSNTHHLQDRMEADMETGLVEGPLHVEPAIEFRIDVINEQCQLYIQGQPAPVEMRRSHRLMAALTVGLALLSSGELDTLDGDEDWSLYRLEGMPAVVAEVFKATDLEDEIA